MSEDYNSPDVFFEYYGYRVRYQSLVPLKVFLKCKGAVIGQATAFCIRVSSKVFLVSNWHVFSGRNYETGQPIDQKNGATPDTISVVFHHKVQHKTNSRVVEHTQLDYPLYNGEKSIWKQHQTGQKTDVAALSLADVEELALTLPININAENSEANYYPGLDVFVVGFPEGLEGQARMPIWKRGTIASETFVNQGRVGQFLIDVSTRKGMSGSPVYRMVESRTEFGHSSLALKRGSMTPIGIYSGRLQSRDRLGAEIGKVWPISFAFEVIKNGVPGSYKVINKDSR